MEEGKRGRTSGRQRKDEFRLGHMECEVSGDTSSSHVEGCRGPACREGRAECQRLPGQDHKAWSQDRPLCTAERRLVLHGLGKSVCGNTEGGGRQTRVG